MLSAVEGCTGDPRQRPKFIFDYPQGEHHFPIAFTEPKEAQSATRLEDVRPLLKKAEKFAIAGEWVAIILNYTASPAFDPAHRVRGDGGLPLAWFGRFSEPVGHGFIQRLEHEEERRYAVGPWSASVGREAYVESVNAIHESIRRGDTYQVNYTLRLQANFAGDDLQWFLALRRAQPHGYCAYLDLGRHRVLSASPELFFRRDRDVLTCKPMKGTAPRGTSREQDAAIGEWLRHSAKNRAENAMIVDVLRNDLSRIALTGSVQASALFALHSFPTVHQMISTVTARVSATTSLDDILAALFPCGSVTGAPKISAMQVIADLETATRSLYCGAIGLISPGGDCIFSVAIRTICLDTLNGTATCGVGGGITSDSTADEEYAEAYLKSKFLNYSLPNSISNANESLQSSP